MKKNLFILVLIMLVSFAYAAEDDKRGENKKENAEKKMSELVALSGNITGTVEFGLVDSNDDANEVNVAIAKNRPVFTTEAEVFAKLLMFKHENIIFGPVAYTMIEGKMDHKAMVSKVKLNDDDTVDKVKTKDIWFFEKGEFFNYAGIKIGTTFGKAVFGGSKFTLTVPFMVKFLINQSNDQLTVPDIYASNEADYFSHLILGTNLIAHLQLKSKPYHFGFDVKNSIMIGGDVAQTNTYSLYAYELMYFTMKNSVTFTIKPFNFINNKVDVEFAAAFRSSVEFTGYNIEMKKRAYFGIKWDGLKYFALGYKPFIYSDEKNYLTSEIISGTFRSYKNVYNFSTEVSVSFGNKYFDVEIAYEPSYYTYDDSDEDHAADNSDGIREHKITAAVEIKF